MSKRKCYFNENPQKEYSFFEKCSETTLFCRICLSRISIASGGKAHIATHLKSDKHQKAAAAISSTSTVKDFLTNFSENSQKLVLAKVSALRYKNDALRTKTENWNWMIQLLATIGATIEKMKNKGTHSRSKLDEVLRLIYKLDVALEDTHENKKILVLTFLQAFKEDCEKRNAVFAKFFEGFYLTGSYFEGLRVREATEFDINVVFEIPLSVYGYKVHELEALPSFTKVQLDYGLDLTDLIPFVGEGNFLVKENLLKWFQSLLDSFLNSVDFDYPGVVDIKTSNSGPARTVKIFYKSEWISIDLVPVFSLDANYLEKFTFPDTLLESTKDVNVCYIVPKPLKPELLSIVPKMDSEYVWRIHFPEAEKVVLGNRKNLKCVIKLAKDLRDKEEWPLPSYFLKVVALWLVVRHPEKEFWSKQSLSSLFLLFLQTLEVHLREQCLGHIFYPEFNLFHSLHQTLLRNLQHRIKKIICLLKKNPEAAFELFKISSQPQEYVVPPLLHYANSACKPSLPQKYGLVGFVRFNGARSTRNKLCKFS